jgi:hypothetical protein
MIHGRFAHIQSPRPDYARRTKVYAEMYKTIAAVIGRRPVYFSAALLSHKRHCAGCARIIGKRGSCPNAGGMPQSRHQRLRF